MRKKSLSFRATTSAVILAGIFSIPFFSYAGIAPNPIANPGVETAQQNDATTPYTWKRGAWGTNNAVFSYPTLGAGGTKTAKVEITSYESGDAKWYFDDVPVVAGEQYVFSGQYLANVPADVVARYTLRGGDYRYAYLGTSVISTEWTGYETFPFIVPEDAVSLTVFHLIRETGSLSLDNVSLRLLPPPPSLSVTVREPAPSLPFGTAGGAIPLSYIIKAPVPPPISPSAHAVTPTTTQTAERKPLIPIINAVAKTINEMTSPLVYSAEAEEKAPSAPGFFEEASAATVESAASTPASGPSERTILFLGLLFLLVSLSVPILTNLENNEIGREEQLWEP